jgi:hypothetical protein
VADRQTLLGDLRAVAGPFAASRAALLAVGLLTHILILPYMARGEPIRLAQHAALEIWGRWDSGWYVGLATAGYARHPGADGYVNWAFFPAFPFLSAGVAKAAHVPVFLSMLAVANLSFVVALVLLRRLARSEFGERAAGLAVLLVCAIPGSYVFSAAYTESMFLAATLAALLFMRSGRWLAAGAFTAFAVLTRNLGVGLLLPMAVLAAPRLWSLWKDRRTQTAGTGGRLSSEVLRLAAAAALPMLALAGFALLLYRVSGDPLAFVAAQKGWGRTFGDPISRPLAALLAPETLTDNNDLMSFAFVWLSLALLAALALTRKWWLVAYAAFLVFVPLSTGIYSYQRYCLVMAPLFMTAAALLARRPERVAGWTVVALAILNGFMMTAWTLGLGITA